MPRLPNFRPKLAAMGLLAAGPVVAWGWKLPADAALPMPADPASSVHSRQIPFTAAKCRADRPRPVDQTGLPAPLASQPAGQGEAAAQVVKRRQANAFARVPDGVSAPQLIAPADRSRSDVAAASRRPSSPQPSASPPPKQKITDIEKGQDRAEASDVAANPSLDTSGWHVPKLKTRYSPPTSPNVAETRPAVPSSPSSERRHRVRDGDTLAALAARYLGDSRRGGEIFAVNQPLLTSPDLLPVGVELVIPRAVRSQSVADGP